MEDYWLKEIKCPNFGQDNLTYSKSCDIYKKKEEKEILEMKHRKNASFLEAKKIVGTYMGENSYASDARRADTINQENKYRALVEKLIQLEPNDWPKFQEHLKKTTFGRISPSTNSTTS